MSIISKRIVCLSIILLLTFFSVFAEQKSIIKPSTIKNTNNKAKAFYDCNGSPNTATIYTKPPVFLSKTTNGKHYMAGEGADAIHVLHLYGTAYEMGLAYGQLLKQEIANLINNYTIYLEELVRNNSFLKNLPKEVADYIALFGLDAALDLNYEITKSYVPQRFIDETQGIADGSGVSFKALMRFNYLPEITKAGCSMFGAWGEATKLSMNGTLLQLRALDWDTNTPARACKSFVVYHPSEAGSNAFANIGYCGLIGTITGYSNSRIGISEKVWLDHPDDYDGRIGKPWTFALRDTLQFAFDLDSALTELINTHRTCSIHVGVGDSKTGQFRGVQYSAKRLNIFNWMTQPEYPQHPRLDSVVYWDKHAAQNRSYCFGKLLEKYHGQLNVENTIQIIAMAQTGNVQAAVYDFAKNQVYVANERTDDQSGPKFAYERTFIKFDMTSLFNEKL
ncbi:hypothetical protein ABK040_012605 [Willaertia magna]